MMMTERSKEPVLVEREVAHSEMTPTPWYRRVSWGAIVAGVVVALLAQFMLEMLGVTLGVAAFEPGEDTLGPSFTTSIVVWLAATALLSLFAGGLVTGKLSNAVDPLDVVLEALVMMGVATLISFFILINSLGMALRGVSSAIGQGLSLVGATVEEVSTTVASAVDVREDVLASIRAEADDILAEDASLTSLRLALDEYLLSDAPGDDTRQAAITALTTQTELTEQEAQALLADWESEVQLALDRLEAEAEQVSGEIADIIAATAGVIFMILVAGVFAAGAGGFVAFTSWPEDERTQKTTVRRQTAEYIP